MTSITIRVDDDFKARVERMAKGTDMHVQEYTVRALKRAMDPQCPDCGRSCGPMPFPVGLSPAFEDWVSSTLPLGGAFFLTTLEAGARVVYWAGHRHLVGMTRSAGALPVVLFVGDRADTPHLATMIPTGVITGWGDDTLEGREYVRLRASGYRDGNEAARRAHRGQLPV